MGAAARAGRIFLLAVGRNVFICRQKHGVIHLLFGV